MRLAGSLPMWIDERALQYRLHALTGNAGFRAEMRTKTIPTPTQGEHNGISIIKYWIDKRDTYQLIRLWVMYK